MYRVLKDVFYTVILVVVSIEIRAEDNVECEDSRCSNSATKSFLGLSFTPSYKTLYEINVLDDMASCSNEDATTISLPGDTRFRQTLDEDSQSESEILVHVFTVDELDSQVDDALNKKETITEYFSSPFKVCLDGTHEVSRSSYKRIGGVSTGVLVVPFKLRDGDIYSDTTVGPYISYKWEVIEMLATIGLSQISVSEVGSEDVESRTGLTGAVGVNFEVDKNWDVALLAGVDHLSGKVGDEWKYQGEPWYSFAIGFNFTR